MRFNLQTYFLSILVTAKSVVICGDLVAKDHVKATRVDPKSYQADFKNPNYTLVQVGTDRYVMTGKYQTQGELFYHFKPRPDDAFLVSFPTSGHFWMSEVAWLILHDLDFKTANVSRVIDKVPLLEANMTSNTRMKDWPYDRMKSPRFLRTYLPFSLIPEISKSATKIIYLARNPKDTIVDDFKSEKQKKVSGFTGNIDKYWEYFQKNLILYTPYWNHLKEGIGQRDNPRVLFLFIEEDPATIVQKVYKFLKNQNNAAVEKQITDHITSKMKIEKNTWQKQFSANLNKEVNKWISANIGNIVFPNINVYA